MGKHLKISWLERFLTPAASFCCFGFARPASYFLIRETHFVIRLFVAACLNYTCRLKQKEMVRFEKRNSNLKCLHSFCIRSWISPALHHAEEISQSAGLGPHSLNLTGQSRGKIWSLHLDFISFIIQLVKQEGLSKSQASVVVPREH